MKILDIQVMRGPNIWSNYRQLLIVMKLDLEELELKPTHRLPGFSERIRELMPSLHSHRCSEGHKGGFFQRVEQGTWMGHVIEHIALELQTLAGMDCGYGRTRSTGITGVYHVVIAYRIEEAGLYATQTAIRIAEALINNRPFDLAAEIHHLVQIRKKHEDDPSTAILLREAKTLDIPVKRCGRSLFILGHGIHQRKIRKNLNGTCSGLGISMIRDQEETREFLSSAYIPFPGQKKINNEEDLCQAFEELRFPLLMKWRRQEPGAALIAADPSVLRARYAEIADDHKEIFVEEQLAGDIVHFTLVNFKVVAAAKERYVQLTGDGSSSLKELITQSAIETESIKDKTPIAARIPAAGELINLQLNGYEDVSDEVHQQNKDLAERIATLLDLNLCTLSFVCHDVALPINAETGGLTAVKAGADLRLHHSPAKGLARNITQPVLDHLFPASQKQIPVIAISGTGQGPETGVLLSHLLSNSGKNNSIAIPEGVFINWRQITDQPGIQFDQAQNTLFDPFTECAILCCDAHEVLYSGLAFDTSHISVITEIAGSYDASEFEIEDLNKTHEVVMRCADENGCVILNADDDAVYGLREKADARVVLYSYRSDAERVREHCHKGGTAAFIEDSYLVIQEGKWKNRLLKTQAEGLSISGSTLPAILAAQILGLSSAQICHGLKNYQPETGNNSNSSGNQSGTVFYRKAS